MRLIFVRHAESEANAQGRMQGHADFPLSDRGRSQAESLFRRFTSEGLEPTHAYSSPLKRTAETAQIVSRGWPLEISYSDDLKEHDIGVFSGLTRDEASAAHPEMLRAYEESMDWAVVDGAESLADQRARAERVVQGLVGGHRPEDRVVVFTHGGILLNLLSVVMGTDRLWSTPLENTTMFDFTLDVERWNRRDSSLHNRDLWWINRFGDASHVGTEGRPPVGEV